MSLGDHVPLGQARDWLRARLDKGDHCPLCGQYAKKYNRHINAGMARSLILMWRAGGTDTFVYVPDVCGGKHREEGKLAYWGLVEELPEKREDGGRAGWWRVTESGERFVRGTLALPYTAVVYDKRVLAYKDRLVTIRDCLKQRFDYFELMEGR